MANENHDERGRFASGGGSGSGKSPLPGGRLWRTEAVAKAAGQAAYKAEIKGNKARALGKVNAAADAAYKAAREREYRAEIKGNALRSFGAALRISGR